MAAVPPPSETRLVVSEAAVVPPVEHKSKSTELKLRLALSLNPTYADGTIVRITFYTPRKVYDTHTVKAGRVLDYCSTQHAIPPTIHGPMRLVNKQSFDVAVRVPRQHTYDMPIFVMVDAMRVDPLTRLEYLCPSVAMGTFAIGILAGDGAHVRTIDLYHAAGAACGSLSLSCPSPSDASVYRSVHPPYEVGSALWSVWNVYTRFRDTSGMRTNIDYLPWRQLDTVYIPSIGTIPLCWWSLISSVTCHKPNHADDRAMIRGLMAMARYSMSISDTDRVVDMPLATRAELLGRMCVMQMHFMLYVVDSVKSPMKGGSPLLVDQWTLIGYGGMGEKVGYDCEEGARFAVDVANLIRDHPIDDIVPESKWGRGETKSDIVALVELARRYTPVFCIGTIRLGQNRYSYHAFGMLLDRLWVDKLVKSAPTASTDITRSRLVYRPAHDDVSHPPILLEATGYCTSCFEYAQLGEPETMAELQARLRPFDSDPASAAVAIVSGVVQRDNMLQRHALQLCGPALLRDHGVTRVDLVDESGNLGVAVSDLLQHSRRVHVLQLHCPPADATVIRRTFNCFPDIPSLSSGCAASEPGIREVVCYLARTELASPLEPIATRNDGGDLSPSPLYNICRRGCDYRATATLDAIRSRLHRCGDHGPFVFEVATMRLLDKAVGVHIFVWHVALTV